MEQAIDRSGHRIRDIKSYFEVRRGSIAAKAAFAMMEQALDIPDEVMSHPVIQEMVLASADMIVIANVSDTRD